MLGDFTNNRIIPVAEGIKRPLWSVMIPTYNPKEYIYETLESVLSQYPDDGSMQLEIVDDCSTKVDIPAMLSKLGDKRVLYYRNPKNVGHSFNFTEAVRRSRGHIVQILHDDDLVKPGFYGSFAEAFDKFPTAGAVYCRQEYIDDDGKTMFFSNPDLESPGLLEDAVVKLAERQRIQYCAMAVRRSTYEKVGGYLMKNIGCEDWEMWVRIASQFDIAYLPEALAKYRIHTTSMTLTDMRSGQDMRFMREAADIFTQYVPEELRDEVTRKRNVHYGNYSFENAKKLFKQNNDEVGAAAQLSETIILDSNRVYANLDLVSELKTPVQGMGMSIIVPVTIKEAKISETLRQLANLRRFAYIPAEIVLVNATTGDEVINAALDAIEKFRIRLPLKTVSSRNSNYFDALDSGIRNSKYEFCMICNPGDFPDINYLKIGSESMLMANDIGAMGGRVVPFSKSELPNVIHNFKDQFGIGEVLTISGLLTDSNKTLHSGGLLLRKSAWSKLTGLGFRMDDIFGELSPEIVAKNICRCMRASGWRVYYNSDLSVKKEFTGVTLNKKNLLRVFRSFGRDFYSVKGYKNLELRNSEGKPGSLKIENPTSRKRYRHLRKCYADLKSQLAILSHLKPGGERHSKLMFEKERTIGVIQFIISGFGTDLSRLRMLRRAVKKHHLGFFRKSVNSQFFTYPRYPAKSSTVGISVIMVNRAGYMPDFYRALRRIADQKLSNNLQCEVVLVDKTIDEETRLHVSEVFAKSEIPAPVNFIVTDNAEDQGLLKYILEGTKYEHSVLLTDSDRVEDDFVRNAYFALEKLTDKSIIFGKAEIETSVAAPKWFGTYKSAFWSGNPDEHDIRSDRIGNFTGLYAPVFRKSELVKALDEYSQSPNGSCLNFNCLMLDLVTKRRLSAGYVQRLKVKHYVYTDELKWENLRKRFRRIGRNANFKNGTDSAQSVNGHNQNNGRQSALLKSLSVAAKLGKYPLKKVFSEVIEFSGDSELLEIEKLKGELYESLGIESDIDKIAYTHLPFKHAEQSKGNESVTPGISVVICCYNSSKVLPQTLGYLFRQKVSPGIEWEMIVVDNASTDNTGRLAEKMYRESNCRAAFRVVREITPGLSAARNRGLNESKHDYVIYCDDDNHLENDFVELSYRIMSSDPQIGVLGGQSIAEFDVPPPGWFKAWQNSFAIGKQGDIAGDVTWTRGYVWGAAMVVNRAALKGLVSKGFRSRLTDRKGNALSAGGDTEICYALRNAGYKIWYDPRLKFRHHIPEDRIDWMHLRKLFKGFGKASGILDIYLKEATLKFPGKNVERIPAGLNREMRRAIRTLRQVRYKKLLTYNRKRTGDSDLPMIEYCLGRIRGLMKAQATYNRGLRLLKRNTRKNDLRYLRLPFGDLDKNFPGYDTAKKLNGVSVIICTYNGASRLADTIRHVALQKVKPEILWEVILVDNASTDNSKEVVINEWNRHKCNAKLKIVNQPAPGKQLALEKGYEVASYEYWITCDDDNWLDENFVQLTYDIMSSNDEIGALGGPNDPLCEVEPPGWFQYFKRDYAGGPQPDVHTGIVSEGNITWKRGYVWGAGMIVRRKAWEQLIRDGFKTSMTCRKGTELSSGGDSEQCYALVLAGWEIWYDSRLKLKHCMPGGRLNWDYLVRLFRGFGKATVGLELYEKAILLAKADTDDNAINKQNWRYEFFRAIKELRKYGIRKILSLRHPQTDNTDVLMLEFYLEKLRELIKSRKEYDRNFETLKKAPWKKDFKYLKAQHRKFLESENDFRYGWPWSENTYNSFNASQPKTGLPKISVLSPSFNSEGTIEKAILSVINQGYPDYELIICDGGSNDGTVEILKKYPQVKWVSEKDKGQSDAMNKAYSMSTGEIIVYLNVDDYFQRGAFFEVARMFRENPEADMVISNLFFEFANHTFTRIPETDYRKIMQPFKYMFPINPVSYFYRRRVQEKIGPFPIDNHFTMDYWFLLKAYKDFKIVKTDYHLGTFCMNGYNKTSNADNRKNTHHRVMYHCWHYDKKLLPFYMYNYYRHFYYDSRPWDLKRISYEVKRFLSRLYAALTLKKNKQYSAKLYEIGRHKYFEKKRLRASIYVASSFLMFPKSMRSSERLNIMLYSLLGVKLTEKGKNIYRFFAYPPGMSLSHKLNYYGEEYLKNGKSVKGSGILLLSFFASPRQLYLKRSEYRKNTKGFEGRSQIYFERAGSLFNQKKRFKALAYAMLSLAFNPLSSGQRSRRRLIFYSALGENAGGEIKILAHLIKDDKNLELAYKLNYYGNKVRDEGRSGYGQALLILSYILSPKYIKQRTKAEKPGKIYSTQIQDVKIKAVSEIIAKVKSEDVSAGTEFGNLSPSENSFEEAYKAGKYKLQLFYDYFRYRKFKANSKHLHSEAIDLHFAGKNAGISPRILKSFLLYPPSLLSRSRWSLLANSVLSPTTKEKLKKLLKR